MTLCNNFQQKGEGGRIFERLRY